VVDRKASKGRKLKYEVIAKLQSFVFPERRPSYELNRLPYL
jgi:hypothetical protein